MEILNMLTIVYKFSNCSLQTNHQHKFAAPVLTTSSTMSMFPATQVCSLMVRAHTPFSLHLHESDLWCLELTLAPFSQL
ncbi:hypothetical protein MPTK1_Vg00380 [Marchantia polymorpha subsp. ruderalis]|uniref:Uncharacterized protein n=1 Tax=Marchantia polymorpha TaxID=3197 RepID=A0A2R6VWP8_MARPO|nr:hypothetical protein MARPO_YB0014 [Marchantia polymorpha]BBN20517.1 hypothetical protein Mp_Vg00380 [Marchantia polymorpha subsp. ruderalis]|eukprot:PTQ26040.1 hypothetical protein MARPO_YB0014 [Marchantia polymorpha]